MLSPDTTAVIKATAPVLAEHGLAITRHFYQRLFQHNPELKNVFNQAHQAVGDQPQALANAVHAYAVNIEQPQVLEAALRRIAHKHASLRIMPEQYDIVGHHLLASIREVLGEAATDQIIDAWAEAYQQLAGILIDAEAALYKASAESEGGWSDWRKFEIRRKEPESSEITSFYLYPVDGGSVPPFQPGQYVSVKVTIPSLGLIQPRQYSLSDAPNGEYLRISVKREASNSDVPGGMVSNLLHDTFNEGDEIELSPPFGEFVLHQERDTPVVLVSGGVGITPMLSMLKTLAGTDAGRDVVFIHGAREKRAQAMREQVREITARRKNVRSLLFLESAPDEDTDACDMVGRVDLGRLGEDMLPNDADYYLCGPLPFIRLQRDQLRSMGVNGSRIHYEVFGSDVLEA